MPKSSKLLSSKCRKTNEILPKSVSDKLALLSSALERKRTITSIPLAEERQILKEIAAVKRSKSQVDEYHEMEKHIQDVKVSENDDVLDVGHESAA